MEITSQGTTLCPMSRPFDVTARSWTWDGTWDLNGGDGGHEAATEGLAGGFHLFFTLKIYKDMEDMG